MHQTTIGGIYKATAPTLSDNQAYPLRVDSSGRILVTSTVAGGVTWGAPTEVTATGSSQTLIAANASRKALAIWNPVGNSQMSIDRAGGTVTIAKGQPLQGGDRVEFSGDECPVGAVTFIGTGTEKIVYQEGT